MDQELISKKELLEIYEISYGALYRWKRRGLIPEEWFIKKSTVTGQETFFPKNLICERIEFIKQQKDNISLEDLSNHFSTESKKNTVIIIDTVFGVKTFSVGDIRSIIIDDGNGNKKDVTKDITGGND